LKSSIGVNADSDLCDKSTKQPSSLHWDQTTKASLPSREMLRSKIERMFERRRKSTGASNFPPRAHIDTQISANQAVMPRLDFNLTVSNRQSELN